MVHCNSPLPFLQMVPHPFWEQYLLLWGMVWTFATAGGALVGSTVVGSTAAGSTLLVLWMEQIQPLLDLFLPILLHLVAWGSDCGSPRERIPGWCCLLGLFLSIGCIDVGLSLALDLPPRLQP